MKYGSAWSGRVFEWKESGNIWRSESETLYITLGKWHDERLKAFVLYTTYPYHKVGQMIELRPSDRMWVEAKRIA